MTTPLKYVPGTRWEYSMSIDWVGLLVEEITGVELGE